MLIELYKVHVSLMVIPRNERLGPQWERCRCFVRTILCFLGRLRNANEVRATRLRCPRTDSSPKACQCSDHILHASNKLCK